MDIAAIEAALPAAVVAAVSGDPQGITAAGQVYFGEKRPPVGSNAVGAWCRQIEATPALLEARMGALLETWTVEARLWAVDGSAISLPTWGDAIISAFHGRGNPAGITGLVTCSVADVEYDEHPGEGLAKEFRCRLVFAGWRDR